MKYLLKMLATAGVLAGLAASAAAAVPGASAWTIGPITARGNYSHGVPLHPVPGPSSAWHIDLPGPGGSVNYVTFRHGSLAGKHRIVMRYRVETAPGVQTVPRTAPGMPWIITLYVQRRGDNWTGRGPFEAYRWYATFASQMPISPGSHQIVAPFSGKWTAVMNSSSYSNPAAFRDALANADQVGFVLGGGDGFGHGVFATGPARLIVTDFRVE